MPIASFAGDLVSLTPLIFGTFGFLTLLLFRKQIQGAIDRARNFEAQRKGVSVKADLSNEREEDSPGQETEAVAKPPRADSEEEDEVIQPGDSAIDLDGATDVRARMLRSYSSGNEKDGDEAFEQLQAIESNPEELKLDRARRLAFRFMGGIDPEGISKLEELVEDEEVRAFVYRMIGMCFESTKQPSRAAEAYEQSAAAARSSLERAQAVTYRSRMLAEAGDVDQAVKELVASFDAAPDQVAQLALWEGLARAYEKADDLEARATALHQAALLAGNNARRWFQAGYAYSNADTDKFSFAVIQCYLMALTFDSNHQWAKNNLGVALQRMGLRIPSSQYYKEAAQLGNTLAMANLALIYLNQGLADEAESLIEEAASKDNPDGKVASVAADLVTRRNDQDRKLTELRENGPQVGEFLAAYGRARIKALPDLPEVGDMEGIGKVDLKVSASSLTASWEVGSYRSRRKFKGEISGRAVSGRFEKEGFSPELESTNWEADGFGFGFVVDDETRLALMKLKVPQVEYFQIRISS